MRAVVCVKQVADPLAPPAAFRVVANGPDIVMEEKYQPVVNGFDEQALEAALRVRDAVGSMEIVAVSVGSDLRPEIMKRTLGGLVDQLLLVHDKDLRPWDSRRIAAGLAGAVRNLGGADLVLCGRQSSDWNAALVPLLLAHELGMSYLALVRDLRVESSTLHVDCLADDGIQQLTAPLPAVVTVTSELGSLRYPSAREKLAAARRQPGQVQRAHLPVTTDREPLLTVESLHVPTEGSHCEFVDSGGGEASGLELARVLLDRGIVASPKGGRP